jgi:DNA mismatch repair protein MSH4
MSTACSPNIPSVLYSLVQDLVTEAQIVAYDRSSWSETQGLDYIQNLAFQYDIEPLKVALNGKFYATASFSAVSLFNHFLLRVCACLNEFKAMKYIEHNHSLLFAPHSLRIRFKPSEDTMMIDISAIQALEIMQNQENSKSKESLFGLLNHTSTPMGSRLLRSSILQPPTKADRFTLIRYDALEELTGNEEMFREVRRGL